jgi:hypothetical protein
MGSGNLSSKNLAKPYLMSSSLTGLEEKVKEE